MPPILIAFWIAVGLGSGLALTDPQAPVYGGVDGNTRSIDHRSKPHPRSWLSAPSQRLATPDVYGREQCSVVVFAVTGGGRVMRAEIDGAEQALDSSWAVDVTARPSEQRVITVRYRDPVGGAELACHSLSFICTPETWDGRVKRVVSNGKACS